MYVVLFVLFLVLSEVGQRPVSDVPRPVGDLSISGGVCIKSLCQRPVNIDPSRSTTFFFLFPPSQPTVPPIINSVLFYKILISDVLIYKVVN